MNEKGNEIDGIRSGCSYKMMKLSNIIIHEELSNIFPIQEYTLNIIIKSINNDGFDQGQPITLWECEEQKFVLVDGHTRMKAAEAVGIKEIPVKIMQFTDINDAKLYAFKCQALRRSLTQKEILEAANMLGSKNKRDGTGRSVDKLSAEMGVSPSTLVHARTVVKKASKEDLDAIKNEKASINSVYQKIKNKKPKKENDNASENNRQKSSLASGLVNIKDILLLLENHNEKTAINIIMENIKNFEIRKN
jgi:ParB-like chromosome segregation protein Spo0J